MAALRAPGGRMQGAAAQAMSVHIVEPPQRSRRPPRRRNPKGAWVLRAIAALLLLDDPHRDRLRRRALRSPPNTHARDRLYFHHGPLGGCSLVSGLATGTPSCCNTTTSRFAAPRPRASTNPLT